MLSLPASSVIAAAFAASLLGQVTVNGTLVGTVLDPSSQVVSDARIVVTRPATNFRQSLSSDSSGRFQLPGLQPGVYDAAVEKPGFQRLLRQGITLEVNQTVQLPMVLAVGA